VAIVLLVAFAAVGVVLAQAAGPPPPPLAEPVEPRYPDLGMAPLDDLLIGHSSDGPVYLRFSATIVNVGDGDLLVAAHRRFPVGEDWAVRQRIDDATGGYSERPTDATLVFGGDGHDHWHVAGAEAHQLETEEGTVVGQLVKTGFCFFDNVDFRTTLPGAPAEATHSARECGGRFDRDVSMGLSLGWGDEYAWYLLDQTIEITDVPDGRYRLRAIADPNDFFAETNEDNNETWTLLDLATSAGTRSVTVVEKGPSA
jgi:hypothetical protein